MTRREKFLGEMERVVPRAALGRGDKSVIVHVGMTLDNGYVVESISVDAVVLVYAPLGVRSTIPIGSSAVAP